MTFRRDWPPGNQGAPYLATLADAIATGLIVVEEPQGSAVLGGVSVTHRRAQLSGVARGHGSAPAIDPRSQAARVTGIDVLNVAVAGVTTERRAG